jgi:protein phosphatase
MSGKNNEDRYAVSAYQLGGDDPTPVVFAVLCDGIGGHRAGEVAAEVAVDTISHVVADSDGHNPVGALQQAISAASERIYSMAQADPNQQGMGATCVCALVIGHKLYAATVGDSRLYLARGGNIRQLSTDHTWIQEALERGLLQPQEVNGHPNAHIIRRFLGSPNPPPADFRLRLNGKENNRQAEANQGMSLKPGDSLLLCSDGLTDLVNEPEIAEILKDKPGEAGVNQMVELANSRGGHDNITIVTLGMPETMKVAAPPRRGWTWFVGGCAAFVVVALLAMIGLGILDLASFVRHNPSATPSPTYTLPPQVQTVLPLDQPAGPSPMPPLSSTTPGLPLLPAPQESGPAPALTPVEALGPSGWSTPIPSW